MPLPAEVWRRILDSGAWAPSGDNLQPWIVEQRGETLKLTVDPARDRSLYNFRCRASLIALGAMVENMAIAAGDCGYVARVDVAPSGDRRLLSASIVFEQGPRGRDPLCPFITQRCTNRKPYRTTPIAPAVLESLRHAVPPDGASELRFIENPPERRILARAASLNDRLLFEMQVLHDGFFKSLRWTREEAESSRDGLFVKTLELGPIAPGFKMMRSWPIVRVMNLLGASRLAPGHSYQTSMRSAAFGFLQMADASLGAFVEGGRRLERIWLTATSLGLSLQPMAGMLYLLPYLRSDEGAAWTGNERSLVGEADALFRQVLPIDDRKAAIMLFRLGYASPPTATSLRRPLDPLRSL